MRKEEFVEIGQTYYDTSLTCYPDNVWLIVQIKNQEELVSIRLTSSTRAGWMPMSAVRRWIRTEEWILQEDPL